MALCIDSNDTTFIGLVHADRIGRGLLQMRRTNSTYVVDERQKRGMKGFEHQTQQGSFQSTEVSGTTLKVNGRRIPNPGGVITTVRQGPVWVDGTMELAEEIATVGLSDDDRALPRDGLAITENMIRAEHGLAKRLKYGQFNRRLA